MLISAEKLSKFIRRRRVAVIGSVDAEGFPCVKAMLPPKKIEGLRAFYFATNTSSQRVRQYLENPNASVYFFRKGLIRYEGVQFLGTMEVRTDSETKRMFWQRFAKLIYKEGVDDPDYCILKFTARSARYYRDLKTEDIPLEP